MAVTASFQALITATESAVLGLDLAADQDFVHTISALTKLTLGAGTTPAVSQVYGKALAQTLGAATIDLTALVRGNLPNADWTGLKVQLMVFQNPTGNGAITIVQGATNPFLLFGTGGSVIVEPGGFYMAFSPEVHPDISASVRDIDISGTASEILNVILLAG